MAGILRKAVTISIVISLMVSTVMAGDINLIKRDVEKVRGLSIFPGMLLPGLPYFNVGNTAEGIFITGKDIFYGYLTYHMGNAVIRQLKDGIEFPVNGIGEASLLAYSVLGMLKNRFGSKRVNIIKETKYWNRAVAGDIRGLEKRYVWRGVERVLFGGALIATGLGVAFKVPYDPLNPGFVEETLLREYGCYAGLGALSLVSGIAYLIQAGRLKKHSAGTAKVEVLFYPVFSKNYNGILFSTRI